MPKFSLRVKKPAVETYAAWRAQKQAETQRTAKGRERLLPGDLAERIFEAGNAELARIAEREEILHKSLANLERIKREIKEQHRRACELTAPPPRWYAGLHERTYEDWRAMAEKRGYLVQGENAVEWSRALKRVARDITAHRLELADLLRKRMEIKRVQRACRLGVKSAVLAVVRTWQSGPALVGELSPIIGSPPVWVDSSGNPLPPEALGQDGQPDPAVKPGVAIHGEGRTVVVDSWEAEK